MQYVICTKGKLSEEWWVKSYYIYRYTHNLFLFCCFKHMSGSWFWGRIQ